MPLINTGNQLLMSRPGPIGPEPLPPSPAADHRSGFPAPRLIWGTQHMIPSGGSGTNGADGADGNVDPHADRYRRLKATIERFNALNERDADLDAQWQRMEKFGFSFAAKADVMRAYGNDGRQYVDCMRIFAEVNAQKESCSAETAAPTRIAADHCLRLTVRAVTGSDSHQPLNPDFFQKISPAQQTDQLKTIMQRIDLARNAWLQQARQQSSRGSS